MPFPDGYVNYDGLEVDYDGTECYLHCSNIAGCNFELVNDFSVLPNGSVEFGFFSPLYGSYIDFYLDNIKILIEYYIQTNGTEQTFIYDIKVFDENGDVIFEKPLLNMSKTILKIGWYGKNLLNIYIWNEIEWGKIASLNISYTDGKWKMNIKGVIEIYSIEVYRRWI